MNADIENIVAGLRAGSVIPYLGPGMLELTSQPAVPATPPALAQYMTQRVTVPHKIRLRLTQAAQFIENFKHRKSAVALMNEAFATAPEPSALHRFLAACDTGLWVDTWYDDTFVQALIRERPEGGWVQVQGLSQSEHFGQWTAIYDDAGERLHELPPAAKLLYRPIGGRTPASNYLVSDADYVEVLTEIDIQTPIPAAVQAWRTGRHFLFVGCRFDDQLTRSFARQIMKRSSDRHWAVLPDAPTRMEARFLREQNITRLAMPLAAFADILTGTQRPAMAA